MDIEYNSDLVPDSGPVNHDVQGQLAVMLVCLAAHCRLQYLDDKIYRKRQLSIITGLDTDDEQEYRRLLEWWDALGEDNQKRVMVFAIENSRRGSLDKAMLFLRNASNN